LARVRVLTEDESYRTGFIDQSGSFAIDPRFESAQPFDRKLAWANNDSAAGYINMSGDFVFIIDRLDSLFQR